MRLKKTFRFSFYAAALLAAVSSPVKAYAWDKNQAIDGYMYFLLPAEYANNSKITNSEQVDLSLLDNFQMKVATENNLAFMWYNLDLYDDGAGNPLYDATAGKWKEQAVEDAMQQGEFHFWLVKVSKDNTTFSLTKNVYKHNEPNCFTFFHWNWDYSKTDDEKGITPNSDKLPVSNMNAVLKTGFKYHFAFYLRDEDNSVVKDYFHLYVTTKSQNWDMKDNNQGDGNSFYRASDNYTYNVVFVKSDGTTVTRALNPIRMHGSEDDKMFGGVDDYTNASQHYLIYNSAELRAIDNLKNYRGFNYYYYNLSFKNDDPMFSNSDDVVSWYIERKDKDGNTKKFGPSADTDLSEESDNYFYHGECTTVSYGHKTSELDGKFQFNRGSLSYTISVDAIDEDHPIIRMFTNTASYESKHTGGFYLVSCGPDGSGLKLWQSEALKKADEMVGTLMTPYYYKDNKASLTSVENADSVVYKVHLEKPTNGWTNMRLLIRPADLATANLGSDTNPSVPFFLKVIRPQMGGDYHGDTYRNSGAMENVDYNQYIELHPGDDVKAVNFTFNASYNTYSIEKIKSSTVKLYDIDNIYYDGIQRVITDVSKGDYRWYKAYSTSKPYYIPTDASGNPLFDVYGVKSLEKGDANSPAKITMEKIEAKVNDHSFIPANVGLVLAGNKSTLTESTTANVPNGIKDSYSLSYESGDKTSTSYSKLELPLGELTPADQLAVKDNSYSSMLTPTCDTPVTINGQWSEGENSGNNYVFGFYENKRGFIKDQPEKQYTLGFWLSTDNETVPANSCYLHLTSSQIFIHNIGTSYYDNSQTQAKPVLMFDFGNTATNIFKSVTDSHLSDNNAYYYTLSGMRVLSPTRAGVYIHNGKKVIVNK